MLTSSQWPGVVIFVSKQRTYVFVLTIDCTLLSVFCSWFVTLWKSYFPWTPLPLGIYNDLPWVGGGVWIFSGTTQLHIKVECQVISKMKPSTTLNLSTKVSHEKSLEWATIELLQTREFVLFFTIMHHKAKWLQRITKIKSFPSWHVWADADAHQRWYVPSSKLMHTLRQFRVCVVHLVLACTVRYSRVIKEGKMGCIFVGCPSFCLLNCFRFSISVFQCHFSGKK